MKKQSKRPSKKCAALSSWLDALAKIAADLAPFPTSVEGFFLDPDFRNLSVELPPQSLVDAALQEADGSHREELTRRAERLEGDYIRFASARSKWREEVADPIRAKRGELGELADPVGKLRTFRRNVCDDVAFLTGLLKPDNKNYIGYQGGMSQTDFAHKIEKDISTIKRWERGEGTPEVFDRKLGKRIKYSADLRKDRLSAITFIFYYKQERADSQGIKNAVQYRQEETDKWNERKRRGYTKATCEPSATYEGDRSQYTKMAAAHLGYGGKGGTYIGID